MKDFLLRLLTIVLFCCGTQMVFGQFTATGTVKDQSNEPLIGATVQVKGTTSGAVTDLDGKFSIQVEENEAVLVISYTGFSEKEVNVSASNPNVEINLESAAEDLAEVIITGYGTSTKEGLTGSVTSLRSEKLEQVPLVSVEQTLQGNVAGLQASLTSGQPGAPVDIRIRGQGSITASSQPLFVVDGVPLYNPGDALTNQSESANVMATFNPNDIASVTVLKDASATAIYGSRAANGVILITTKTGRSGKPKVSLSTQIGWNDWAVNENRRLRGLTAVEYTNLFMEGEINRGRTVEAAIDRFNSRFPDPLSGKPAVDITPSGDSWSLGEVRVDTRWVDEITRNKLFSFGEESALNQSYNLSVSGGTDKVTYFASAAYFEQESPIIGVALDRYSARLNVNAQATEWLKLTNNLNVSRTNQIGPDDATDWSNPLYNGYLLAPVIPIRDEQGLFYDRHKSFFMGGNNPVGSLSGDDDIEWTINRIIDNLVAEVKILDGLYFKSSWAIDLYSYNESFFRNARYGDGRNSNGLAQETTRSIANWTGTQTLNYNKTFGTDHNFGLLAGYEANRIENRSSSVSGEQFPPNNNLRTINNAALISAGSSSLNEFSFQSIFSQLSYNYKYKYYLSGSLRRDGSSRFGSENRYGTFWSVGGSWRLDQEPFVQDWSFVDELKLRSSYGVTGNAEIGNFDWLPSVGFGFDYDGRPGAAPNNIGNVNLTWEESTSFNVGLDFAIFEKINGTIEYFWRESDNLLLDLPVSRTTGFRSATRNFGTMINRGIELTLNVQLIDNEDFQWSVGGNFTDITNEITNLDEPFFSGTDDRFRRAEGREFNEYYIFDWAGVDPATGKGLFYVDENQEATTSDISEANRYYLGKSGSPQFFGGLNTNLSFKGITLDANFVYSWDQWLYDATGWVVQGDGRFYPRSQTNLVLDRWQQPGDVTDIPQFIWGGNPGSNTRPSSRYLYDGTHIRLRSLTLAYQFPQALVSKAKMSSARIYFRGTNLLTWTRDENLFVDPETNANGFLEGQVPNLKTFSFGIDLGF